MSVVDHINVKIMAAPGSAIHWPDAIPVFHRWIQDQVVPELLIDVADYGHVPNGPGVMLIGHEAFYSIDNRAGQLGVLYNRRAPSEGTVGDRIRQAYNSAVVAARRLEAEPEFRNKLSFNTKDCEVFVNDRLLAPNSQATYDSLAPSLIEFFSSEWDSPVDVKWDSDPRGLFRVRVLPNAAIAA